MNAKTSIALAALVLVARSAPAQTSQERRDYILAHPHGWIEITLDDRAIPQVPSEDEDHPGLVKPHSCSLHVELGGEPFLRGTVYPLGDQAPYTAKSGFRFPAPVGSTKLRVGYAGCDVEGEKRATVEAEAPIVVEESRVTRIEFDGSKLYRPAAAKPGPEAR